MATVVTRFLMTQYLSSLDKEENLHSSDPIFARFKTIGEKLKDNSIALTNPESTISWLSDLNDAFTQWRNLKKQKKSKRGIFSAINPTLSDLEKQVQEASSSSAEPSQANLLPLDRYTLHEPHPVTSIGDEVSDEHERQVIDWVNDFKAVGIYGTGGSGKTELVKNVVKQKTVGDKFKRIIWACLSQLNCTEEIDDWIIKYLLYRLGLDTDSLVGNLDENKDWLMEELGRRLQNSGNYILVLDDMWHCSEWFADDFLGKLKKNGGGAVIATSRKKTVAEKIGEKKRLIYLNLSADKESAFLKDEDKDLGNESRFL